MSLNKDYEVWCRSCGCLMKSRKGKYGEFYGCTGYPICKNTMNLDQANAQIAESIGATPDLDAFDHTLEEEMKWGYDG